MADPKAVSDIMSRTVIVLSEEDDLAGVSRAMRRFGLRQIPVVDGDRYLGIVDAFDVAALSQSRFDSTVARNAKKAIASSTFAADIVDESALIVRPDAPVDLAIRHLLDGGAHIVPVVDRDGTLVGVVSIDSVAELARQLMAEPDELDIPITFEAA